MDDFVFRPLIAKRYFDGEQECGVDPMKTIAYAIANRSNRLARERERYAEQVLREKLPRPLHWLVDHPRLLKRVLRVVKRWEPTMTVIQLPMGARMSADAARVVGQTRLTEMRIMGTAIPDGGLVFTYTDVSGLPAEIYGVR